MRSKLSVITARTPSSFGPFAAQSHRTPTPRTPPMRKPARRRAERSACCSQKLGRLRSCLCRTCGGAWKSRIHVLGGAHLPKDRTASESGRRTRCADEGGRRLDLSRLLSLPRRCAGSAARLARRASLVRDSGDARPRYSLRIFFMGRSSDTAISPAPPRNSPKPTKLRRTGDASISNAVKRCSMRASKTRRKSNSRSRQHSIFPPSIRRRLRICGVARAVMDCFDAPLLTMGGFDLPAQSASVRELSYVCVRESLAA